MAVDCGDLFNIQWLWPELVLEGENGWVFDPLDMIALFRY
jgi:hypothetical protein